MKGSFRPGSGDSRYTMGFSQDNAIMNGVFYPISEQTDRLTAQQSLLVTSYLLGFDSSLAVKSGNEDSVITVSKQYWRRIS